ncbi:MAG: tripartite tricarboxylate transporter substrate binding protein [Xanthobacteraceae bacterium]
MKFARRQFLHLAAGAVALPALARGAAALDYPTQPVRILVGFAPGGTTDMVARLIGQYLSQHLGQPFVVENRPGAGTNIATEEVVRARPDGYTLLLVTVSNAINASLFKDISFNFLRDAAPVAGIMQVPNVVVVNPAVPVKTLPEFIAYAKANPAKINMASGGVGSSSHVSGELFCMMAGINLVHVPYRGEAPALTDMVSGQTQVMFDLLSASIGFIRNSKLRPLAVTSKTRSDALPDLPTVADFLPGYEATSFEGLAAPKGTPQDIVDLLNKEVNAALADATFKARMVDLGGQTLPGPPGDFGKLVAHDTEKWAQVIKFANIKPE